MKKVMMRVYADLEHVSDPQAPWVLVSPNFCCGMIKYWNVISILSLLGLCRRWLPWLADTKLSKNRTGRTLVFSTGVM